MATKSEFAQKLLHDLRRRKERMTASQSSTSSNLKSRDAYGNPGQTYRGSQKTKALDSVGSKTVTSNRRANERNQLLTIEDSSKQVVLYGRGQNSKQLGDLPMALAFALQNGGKLGKLDSSGNSSILGFLHQIGRKSLDIVTQRRSSFDKHRSSTSQIPTISHIHIKDISRGVQNLNQVLKACSNGLNFDTYSIEIGKELLKGAMDLEESLRMLVNLQEASDYMITPQRKNRIKLLEEDEDDEDNTLKIAENKQLDLPRFSFDRPSRNSHGIKGFSRTDLKQKLMGLTYPTESPTLGKKQAPNTSNLMPHKRSDSCGPDFKTLVPFSETRNQSTKSHSTQEKGRMSNVIAKLMGLEEPPERIDSQTKGKELSSKQKGGMVMKKNEHASTKNVTPRTEDIKNVGPLTIEKKAIQTNKVPSNPVTTFIQRPEKIQVTPNANPEMVIPKGKQYRQDLERSYRKDAVPGTKKGIVSTGIQQNNISQLNQIPGSRQNIQKERGQDNPMQKEHNTTEKSKSMEPILSDERQQRAPQKHRSSDVADILQENVEGNESAVHMEKKKAERLLLSNQHKPQKNYGLHQLHIVRNSEHQEEKHHAGKRNQIAKQMSQSRKPKGGQAESKFSKTMNAATSLQKKQAHTNQSTPSKRSSTEPIDTNRFNESPNSKQHEDLSRDESSTNSNGNMKNTDNAKSDKNESLTGRVPPPVQENPTHMAATLKKVDYMQVRRNETPRKLAEVMTRQNGTLLSMEKPVRNQTSILPEMKQRRHHKTICTKGAERLSVNCSEEAEVGLFGSNKSEASMQLLDETQQLPNETEKTTTLRSSAGDPKVPPTLTPSDSCENMTSEVIRASNENQTQAPISREDPELNSNITSSNLLNVAEAQKESMEIIKLPQHKNKKMFKSGTHQPLTENGKQLKEILMKSRLFLNTAEALFKLNIPVGILHAIDHNCHDQDAKLLLDCGYEVMKRKGRRQELIVHHSVTISISYVHICNLDDLVRQLCKDFETLKSCRAHGGDECDAADYLLKMLERDVQNSDPDVNAMWDLGWNEMMLAFLEKDSVVKDVERHVLNGLIDEITQDLLHVTISV